MKKWTRLLAQSAIGLFFCWHVVAVGLYAIPMSAQDPVALYARQALLKSFIPYMLRTGQWQQWNLFSPDPLRRVSRYRIESELPNHSWQTVRWITPDTYEWWRHSTHYKMFIGMLEGDQDTFHPAVLRHFLLSHCAANNLPPGTGIRIAYVQYVISTKHSFFEAFQTDQWPPEFHESHGDPAFCP